MFHFFPLLNFYLFPNIFWKYTLLASLLMQTKEILWNHLAQNGFNQFWICYLETDVRFRTNHQQASNRFICILECSLSCSGCGDWSRTLKRNPKKQQNKETFNGWNVSGRWLHPWRKFEFAKKTVCSCKTSNTAEAIYFAHSKSKREFKSDEKEIRLKENKEKQNTKFGGKQQRPLDLGRWIFLFNQIVDWNIRLKSTTTL